MPLCVLPLNPVCVYAPGNIKPCYAAVTYAAGAPSLNFPFQEGTKVVIFSHSKQLQCHKENALLPPIMRRCCVHHVCMKSKRWTR